MKHGHVKLSRKMFDGRDQFWEERRRFSHAEAWIDVLQMAAYRPKVERCVQLERGQVFVSLRWLAQRWRWSPAAVLRFIRELEHCDRVRAEQQVEQSGTVYTVVNYGSYQTGNPGSGTANKTLGERPNSQANGERNSRRNTGARGQPVGVNEIVQPAQKLSETASETAGETVRETVSETAAKQKAVSTKSTTSSESSRSSNGNSATFTAHPSTNRSTRHSRSHPSAGHGGSSNWLEPVLEVWKRCHGNLPDPKIRGKLMRGLSTVYRDGQTPEQMAERFDIWLASVSDTNKHQYVEDFTSRYGDYDPEKCSATDHVLGILR